MCKKMTNAVLCSTSVAKQWCVCLLDGYITDIYVSLFMLITDVQRGEGGMGFTIYRQDSTCALLWKVQACKAFHGSTACTLLVAYSVGMNNVTKCYIVNTLHTYVAHICAWHYTFTGLRIMPPFISPWGRPRYWLLMTSQGRTIILPCQVPPLGRDSFVMW